jgi:hypothetical protein
MGLRKMDVEPDDGKDMAMTRSAALVDKTQCEVGRSDVKGCERKRPRTFPTCDIGQVEVKAALPEATLVLRDLREEEQAGVRGTFYRENCKSSYQCCAPTLRRAAFLILCCSVISLKMRRMRTSRASTTRLAKEK